MSRWDSKLAELSGSTLATFSEEFSLAAKGKGVRHQIDAFVASETGLDALPSQIYELLAIDPVISKVRL